MKLTELKASLVLNPEAPLRFILPDGDEIPVHFHITELGYVTKRSIDCGGMVHDRKERCLLQVWVADDYDHRLKAVAFAEILQLGDQVLPHDQMDVEVEYDCCAVAQYSVSGARFTGEDVELQLGAKRTTCLAKERRQGEGECCPRGTGAAVEPACC